MFTSFFLKLVNKFIVNVFVKKITFSTNVIVMDGLIDLILKNKKTGH